VNGAWQGRITAAAAAGAAAAALTQRGAHVTGTLTADAGPLHGTFAVSGRVHGGALRLRGRRGRIRLVWRAHLDAATWSGPLAVRGRRTPLRAALALTRDAAGGVRCGDGWFASDVMPRVLVPICAQCHVEGGLAATAPFRVTVGDAGATVLSALREIDAGDPSQSKILLKPRAALPHGGGQRLVPGSAEDDVLARWVALVTAPGCGPAGGGGGPRTGAQLWADECASCHGADAGGQGEAPNVRCATRVDDALGRGRGTAMPAFPELLGADLSALESWLDGLCTTYGRTGAALYAGNCATCHGPTARGGRNALGVAGPGIACEGGGDYQEKVANGDGRMPAFPALDRTDVDLIVSFAHAELCTGG
jgi:mono/diheme cytochrome c family protein